MRDEASDGDVDAERPGQSTQRRKFSALISSRSPIPPSLRACWEASGGNPFYLTELARTLGSSARSRRARPRGGSTEISPRAIASSVLARLGHMPPDPQRRSPDGPRCSARMRSFARRPSWQDSTRAEASQARGRARQGGDPRAPEPACASFTHWFERRSTRIFRRTGARDRHGEAARMLLELRERRPSEVASHLLLNESPAGEAEVQILGDAAQLALARAAPASALSFLRRALADVPAGEARGSLLLAAGKAARAAGDPAAVWAPRGGPRTLQRIPRVASNARASLPPPRPSSDLRRELARSSTPRSRRRRTSGARSACCSRRNA